MSHEVVELPIDLIVPNPYQPRHVFSEDSLFELAQSIREHGLISPIAVRRRKTNFEIIAGERRYRAMILAGFTKIPAYVMSKSDQQIAQMALIENIQREDLSAIEEAHAYVDLLRYNRWTQEQLAKKIGKSQSSIANKIRILQLPTTIQEAVSQKVISERHARALLHVVPEQQENVYNHIVQHKLTVAQSERFISKLDESNIKRRTVKTKGTTKNILIVKNTLKQALALIEKAGTEVSMVERESETHFEFVIKVKK